eukprot:2868104-Amphidinium_carterae.2
MLTLPIVRQGGPLMGWNQPGFFQRQNADDKTRSLTIHVCVTRTTGRVENLGNTMDVFITVPTLIINEISCHFGSRQASVLIAPLSASSGIGSTQCLALSAMQVLHLWFSWYRRAHFHNVHHDSPARRGHG